MVIYKSEYLYNIYKTYIQICIYTYEHTHNDINDIILARNI